MNVANRKCIRNISIKNMRTARLRNLIAVAAIALTTVLFTSLFTVFLSVIHSYEQSNFRQVGGYAHCGLKNLTEAQYEEFRDDPLMAEYGKRVFLGTPAGEAFRKTSVEISSVDENYARFCYVDLAEGSLPAEHTNEAAADTRVLSLLGVAPKIGTEFTLTLDIGGKEITQDFILCGYWEFDNAMPVSNIFLPFSRGEELLETLEIEKGFDGMTGLISLNMMLKSGSAHIEQDVQKIIESHGYQWDAQGEARYIDYGVNWGYLNAQMDNLLDAGTLFALIALLLLIVFTGYLIIYNVFRISVSNDIRYYGLLKTIGTTGRQIRRIISIQAYALSAIGIPVGLLLGYLVGAILTPVVITQFEGLRVDSVAVNPLIFLFATLFSLATVILSCKKPGRIAARISPVEALRYTESSGSKQIRRSQKGANLLQMAAANLSRTKSRTLITILSLALSVLLFHLTVTFTNGFDLIKYLRRFPVDYMVADAGYFHHTRSLWNTDMALPEETISELRSTGAFSEIGATYGKVTDIRQFMTDDAYRQAYSKYWPQKEIEEMLTLCDRENGLILDSVQLYGMDPYCLEQLTVLDGDLSRLKEDGNYIAAVYPEDDYGNPEPDSHHAKVGDKILLRLADSEEHGTEYHDTEYEVVAAVIIPASLTYRFYGSYEYILNAEAFQRDTGSDRILYLALKGREGAEQDAEQFLSEYTETRNPLLDYESRLTYVEEFDGFRKMFVLLGTVLSFIVGLVGILNFINAILTGIFARHRELAVLQAIGMTGRQLKRMLITEGLFYTFGAVGSTLILSCVFAPLSKMALENMFWFFTFRFSLLPIFLLIPLFGILGVLIPYIAYRFAARRSVVERIRNAE